MIRGEEVLSVYGRKSVYKERLNIASFANKTKRNNFEFKRSLHFAKAKSIFKESIPKVKLDSVQE